jgi:hypothetical protein
MSNNSSANRSFRAYLIVGILVVLTIVHVAIIRFRQRDFDRFAGSQVPRIIELNRSKRVPFTKEGIDTVVSGILTNDMVTPEGMRSVDKQTLTKSQRDDLYDAIASFLTMYHSPTPQSVYDYYITNRDGERMRDVSVEIAENAMKERQIDIDRSVEQALLYAKVYWQFIAPEHLKTHWQYLLDGKSANSSCLWEASSPLVGSKFALNSSDGDIFGNTTGIGVFLNVTLNQRIY